MTKDQLVTDELERGVLTVFLNDPETRNALSPELLDALIDALERARKNDHVRVVVLDSTSPSVFSSGGDLKTFRSEEPIVDKYRSIDRYAQLYRALIELPKPAICAARGDVLAGALGIALACDLVVAAETAEFGTPEINVGAFPFMVSALLVRAIPRAKANELLLLGRRLSAQQAERLGIVNAVVHGDELDVTVREWAQSLAERSPLLLELGKGALAATRDMTLDQALEHLRGQLALAFTTDDLQEGVTAFFERRAPRWSGH